MRDVESMNESKGNVALMNMCVMSLFGVQSVHAGRCVQGPLCQSIVFNVVMRTVKVRVHGQALATDATLHVQVIHSAYIAAPSTRPRLDGDIPFIHLA